MEAEFQQEKAGLEQQLEQLEQRLEVAHNHTNLQDGRNRDIAELLREKDDTIAQLEEKLIENDAKIQELTEDLRAEIEESQGLQQNLDQAYDDQAMLKRDLDLAKKESQRLEAQLATLRAEVQEIRGKQQSTEKLREQFSEVMNSMHSIETERERMKTIIDQYKVQVETSKSDLESERAARKDAQRRMEDLQKQNREVAVKCASLAKDLAIANERVNALEEQLSQQGGLESHLKQRYEELRQAKETAVELQQKLAATQLETEQTQELLDQNLDAIMPAASQESLVELQSKHAQVMKEVKRLRGELKQAHGTIDDMEISAAGLQQQYRAMQEDYQQQLELMTSRIQDLTTKLAAAEKRVRKLERKVARSKKKEKDGESDGRKASDASVSLDDLEAELGASDMNSSASSSGSSDSSLQVDEILSSALQFHETGISRPSSLPGLQSHQQLRDHITQLEAKLSSKEDKLKSSHLHEIELKLQNTQKSLEDCRNKLSGVIHELGTYGALPSQDTGESMATIRERLADILKDFDAKANKDIRELTAEEHWTNERLKAFAEKLSLEAVVVGEMASLVKTSQDYMMFGRESYLHDIQHANSKILELERKVQMMQSHSEQQQRLLSTSQQDSMQLFSATLAEKVVLQGRLQLLLEKLREEQAMQLPHSSESQTAKDLSQEALFRSKLDDNLYAKSQDAQTEVSSLASKALIQGELAFVLSKLKERMSDSMTDQERLDFVEQELDIAQQRLHERERNMAEIVESFEMEQLEQFATALAQSEVSSFCNVSREDFTRELVSAIKQRADMAKGELAEVRGEDEERYDQFLRASIEQEVEHMEHCLQQIYEEKLQDAVEEGLQGSRDVSAQTVDTVLSPEAVMKFAEIVGQKAAITGLVSYIMENVKQRQEQQPVRSESTSSLRRHDSGVILHSSSLSLPTSPVNYEDHDLSGSSHDSDLRSMSQRLAQDANTRRELATYLQDYINKDTLPNDQVRAQIAQIAADLVNIDTALLKHRKSIHDYAEMITREAIFQAQMTFIIHKLKMEHEQQLKHLRSQLEAAQTKSVSSDQVCSLEKEIERLSRVVAENGSLLDQEAGDAQARVQLLQKQIQDLESSHLREKQIAEKQHKEQVDHLSTELQETLNQLDDREHEIEELQDRLQELETHKQASQNQSQREVDDLEDELDQAHEDLATLVKQRDQGEVQLRRQIADLEMQISVLSSSHKLELEQTKADMQTAMRAVSSSETNKYEQEMNKLREKLDQEKRKHLVSKTAFAKFAGCYHFWCLLYPEEYSCIVLMLMCLLLC